MEHSVKEQSTVRVGVGCLVIKDGKVLLGKRKGSHGEQQYGGPGGHLEYGETAEQAIRREIAEECGLTIKNLSMLCVSDLLTYAPKHYVDIGFTAEWDAGDPQVLEPEKLESWDWYDIHQLPEPLFGCMKAYVEAYETGRKYFTYNAPE